MAEKLQFLQVIHRRTAVSHLCCNTSSLDIIICLPRLPGESVIKAACTDVILELCSFDLDKQPANFSLA